MINYTANSGVFYDDKRDVVGEFSKLHNSGDIEKIITKSGYANTFYVGYSMVADIEMYFSSEKDTEFAAIALLSLGDSIVTYVFSRHHDAVCFLKEFTPMIESMVNVHLLMNEKKP